MNDQDGNSTPALSRPPLWLAVGSIMATAGVFAIAIGLTYPLLALILKKQEISASLIGANSAMPSLGIIISAPLVPWLARKLGAARTASLCAALAAIFLALIGVFQNVWFWFPARLIQGMAMNGAYIISEAWVIQLSSGQNRGRIMGFYTTVLSIGFASGPVILALAGTEGFVAFGVVVAIMALTAVAMFSIRSLMPDFREEGQGSIRFFLPLAPGLLIIIAMLAFFEQSMLSLLPVYGLHHDLTERIISISVAVLVSGNVVMQFPIGWVADKMPRRKVILICILLTASGGFLLPLVVTSRVLLWPLLFFWGAFSFGSYTVALAELGDRFSGRMLLAGNAAFGMAWGIGGIVGPPLAGGAMDLIGPGVLPLCMGLGFVVLALGVFKGMRSKARRDADSQMDAR